MDEYLKLIGILCVIIGFALKIDTIFVVVFSGIVTGLLAGMNLLDILTVIGDAFVKSRYMLILMLSLPVIGILEKNGLREHSFNFIKEKVSKASPGGIMLIYNFFRMITTAVGAVIGNVVSTIRPLVYPMALGSIKNKYNKEVTPEVDEAIKANATMSENVGNFFSQNIFLGAGGVLLVIGTLKSNGIEVTPITMTKIALIPAGIAFFLTAIKLHFLNRYIDKKMKKEVKK